MVSLEFFIYIDFQVLLRAKEQRNFLHEISKRKANWIGHILCRNCLLRQVIEGKIKGVIEVTDEEEKIGSSGFGGLVVSMLTSGTFGGLVVSMLASGTFGGLVVSMLTSGTFGGLVVSMLTSGTFGGLVVSMLASDTQDRSRPKPSDFFGRKNPHHAFLQKGSKAVFPMSQICGLSKNPITYRGSRKL
jgi:hypothetical protein